MQVIVILLQLAGAVMLLLYSTRMVRTGIERAAGSALRDLFLTTRKSLLKSAGVGVIAAASLQSATAVALLVGGFATTGVMGVTGALAVVLGADLGTALVVVFLSLDLGWLTAVLLLVGGFLFLKTDARLAKQIGRVLMGIALILISLSLISQATVPLRESRFLPDIVAYLAFDPITAVLGGAALAFLFHSSVAAILLFAAFAAEGVLGIAAGVPLVLGANIGGACVAVWLTRSAHIKARRITLGNLAFRLVGALAVLGLMQIVALPLGRYAETEARQLVLFHFAFNAVLVLVFLPFVIPCATLLKKVLRDPVVSESVQPPRVSALDPGALSDPRQALACVLRELLLMAGTVEQMLTPVMELFDTAAPDRLRSLRTMDLEVNERHSEIKLFLAELSQQQLNRDEAVQLMDYLDAAVALERIGDIISKDLLRAVSEKNESGSRFSEDGWAELSRLHARVMANAQMALNVLVSDDVDTALQLVEEKEKMREFERLSFDRHVSRLATGTPESIATSDVHIEVVRALKEINSRYALIGYPVLRQSGMLRDSRLDKTGTIDRQNL
ncbi:MAG: Na/Pi cotransporter family protein [Rhodobacteraceae bacterium]|nr:Na/Pi cotransporter family protein [Paracoccaceae bacterium]NKB29776.1 Na/Pi cotransporter family protein [Paracoccaceae bacterium]